MCTAIMMNTQNYCFFGRNMDLPKSFGEEFIEYKGIKGTGIYIDEIPLFADGMNKDGLGICGLNFKGYARFENTSSGVPAWDFIRWILLNFSCVSEMKNNIHSVIINNNPINKDTPIPTLHWIIGDKKGDCGVIESTRDGLFFYDNPEHVLTNNPTFPTHLLNLKNYSFDKMGNLSDGSPSITLPGDYSSVSRFIKTAYLIKNLPHLNSDEEAINHFFDILNNVRMVKGCVLNGMHTIYSCCMDLKNGTYISRF